MKKLVATSERNHVVPMAVPELVPGRSPDDLVAWVFRRIIPARPESIRLRDVDFVDRLLWLSEMEAIHRASFYSTIANDPRTARAAQEHFERGGEIQIPPFTLADLP